MKKTNKKYKRKDRPVTQTDRYWYQLGILKGRELRIKEHRAEQRDYKGRYYQQARANQYLIKEMNRIDPEIAQSKKISLQRRCVERMVESLAASDDPRHKQLARQLRARLRETEERR